jgi:hypothetical protein
VEARIDHLIGKLDALRTAYLTVLGEKVANIRYWRQFLSNPDHQKTWPFKPKLVADFVDTYLASLRAKFRGHPRGDEARIGRKTVRFFFAISTKMLA